MCGWIKKLENHIYDHVYVFSSLHSSDSELGAFICLVVGHQPRIFFFQWDTTNQTFNAREETKRVIENFFNKYNKIIIIITPIVLIQCRPYKQL